MPDEIKPQAEAIPQTGEAEWFPPIEDDAEAVLKQRGPKGVRRVFYGKDGLRAGWSLLLFLLIVFAFGKIANAVVHHFHPVPVQKVRSSEISVESVLFSDGFGFALLAFAAFLVSLAEKRPFGKYGLGTRRGWFSKLSAGTLLGMAMLSLLVFFLKATGLLVFQGVLLHGFVGLRWAGLWLIAFLLVALAEEFATRGFMQFTLMRGFAGIGKALGLSPRAGLIAGFWLTALVFSVLFALGHGSNPGETPVGMASAGLIGMVFAFSLWRTGSLWWAIGFHAAWDWAQSFLYGVSDSGLSMEHHFFSTRPQGAPLLSGGGTGPEGSICVLVAIALTVALIAFTLPSQPGSPSDPAYSPNTDLLPR